MRAHTKLWLASLLLVVTVGFSGCDSIGEFIGSRPGAESSVEKRARGRDAISIILAFFGVESRKSGVLIPTGPTTGQILDKFVTGPFTGTLPQPTTAPVMRAGGVTVSKAKGSFAVLLNGTTDSAAGTSQLTGTGVLSFKQKKLGRACFEMDASFSKGGTKGKGTFKTTGGTRAAATMRASGSFTDTVSAVDSDTSRDKGKLKLNAKFGKPRKPPNADCKALIEKLPG